MCVYLVILNNILKCSKAYQTNDTIAVRSDMQCYAVLEYAPERKD